MFNKVHGKAFGLALILLLAAGTSAWGANQLVVTAASAMGPSSSSACGVSGEGCGLEIRMDNPVMTGSTNTVYLETNTPNNETAINGSFYINPANVTMSNVVGQNHLQIGYLADTSDNVHVVFFLHRQPDNTWFITIWYKNSNTNNFSFCCNGFLTGFNGVNNPTLFEFEWASGAPGYFRAYRTIDAPGASRILMMQNTNLTNSGQDVDRFLVGMLNPNNHFPGTFGTLRMDEFVLTRAN